MNSQQRWTLVATILGVVLANHRFGPLPVHHLGKMGTFAILFTMPVLLAATRTAFWLH